MQSIKFTRNDKQTYILTDKKKNKKKTLQTFFANGSTETQKFDIWYTQRRGLSQ